MAHGSCPALHFLPQGIWGECGESFKQGHLLCFSERTSSLSSGRGLAPGNAFSDSPSRPFPEDLLGSLGVPLTGRISCECMCTSVHGYGRMRAECRREGSPPGCGWIPRKNARRRWDFAQFQKQRSTIAQTKSNLSGLPHFVPTNGSTVGQIGCWQHHGISTEVASVFLLVLGRVGTRSTSSILQVGETEAYLLVGQYFLVLNPKPLYTYTCISVYASTHPSIHLSIYHLSPKHVCYTLILFYSFLCFTLFH